MRSRLQLGLCFRNLSPDVLTHRPALAPASNEADFALDLLDFYANGCAPEIEPVVRSGSVLRTMRRPIQAMGRTERFK